MICIVKKKRSQHPDERISKKRKPGHGGVRCYTTKAARDDVSALSPAAARFYRFISCVYGVTASVPISIQPLSPS
jgi:hypothetical protein